jgi:hypothetical protein
MDRVGVQELLKEIGSATSLGGVNRPATTPAAPANGDAPLTRPKPFAPTARAGEENMAALAPAWLKRGMVEAARRAPLPAPPEPPSSASEDGGRAGEREENSRSSSSRRTPSGSTEGARWRAAESGAAGERPAEPGSAKKLSIIPLRLCCGGVRLSNTARRLAGEARLLWRASSSSSSTSNAAPFAPPASSSRRRFSPRLLRTPSQRRGE